MSATRRFFGIALGLAVGLLVGVSLTAPGRAAATTPSAAPIPPSGGITVGAPGALPAVRTGGTTVSASGSAIAYPYFGGAPGIAPDHTIVVTGVGQADIASDGSDHGAAQTRPSLRPWPTRSDRPMPSPQRPDCPSAACSR